MGLIFGKRNLNPLPLSGGGGVITPIGCDELLLVDFVAVVVLERGVEGVPGAPSPLDKSTVLGCNGSIQLVDHFSYMTVNRH